mgnify:CR=1 FL=1
MLNLVLFGPPGAGKGTQSAKLVERFNLVHLSTGDIFRYNIRSETELGKLARNYMERGALVPDDVTIGMLGEELKKHPKARGFIFDGFPRTETQAEALDEFMNRIGQTISYMIALEVEEEQSKKRLIHRGDVNGRPDDMDPEIIKNRLIVYKNETAPVAGYYRKQKKYKGIDGMGSIDEIFELISKVVEKGEGVTMGNEQQAMDSPDNYRGQKAIATQSVEKATVKNKSVPKPSAKKEAVAKAIVKNKTVAKKPSPKKKVVAKAVVKKKSSAKKPSPKKKVVVKAVKKKSSAKKPSPKKKAVVKAVVKKKSSAKKPSPKKKAVVKPVVKKKPSAKKPSPKKQKASR